MKNDLSSMYLYMFSADPGDCKVKEKQRKTTNKFAVTLGFIFLGFICAIYITPYWQEELYYYISISYWR